MPASPAPRYSIRDLSRMSGISSDRIRAWELRHHLFSPRRRASGYREYGPRDLEVLLSVKRRLASGESIGEVAALGRAALLSAAGGGAAAPAGDRLGKSRDRAVLALRKGDMNGLMAAIETGSRSAIEDFYERLARPLLVEVGDLWALGKVPVWLEHFLTRHLRQRLETLWAAASSGAGPAAVLFCPEGELHENALIAVAVRLQAAGFRPVILGAHLPVSEAAQAARQCRARVVAVSITTLATPAAARRLAEELGELAGRVPVVAGGRGAERHRGELERRGVRVADLETLGSLTAGKAD